MTQFSFVALRIQPRVLYILDSSPPLRCISSLVFVCWLFFFWDIVSLSSLAWRVRKSQGCPETHDPSASVSRVLRLQSSTFIRTNRRVSLESYTVGCVWCEATFEGMKWWKDFYKPKRLIEHFFYRSLIDVQEWHAILEISFLTL